MTPATYISARELFLAHNWRRYPAYPPLAAETGLRCGRIISKEPNFMALSLAPDGDLGTCTLDDLQWSFDCIREPSAIDSVPSVAEVLSIGDWVGVTTDNQCILFSPCLRSASISVSNGQRLSGSAREWATFLETVRTFFKEREFLEMTTPTLAISPGTEPFLDPVEALIEFEDKIENRYLITSPEFHLKKALAAGESRIFEIAKCFRSKEAGPHHRVEFHMLEWYRAFADLKSIADDTESLIKKFRPDISLYRTTMSELFKNLVGFDLKPETSRAELIQHAAQVGLRLSSAAKTGSLEDYTFDDLFHILFLEMIEPKLDELATGRPVLISGYPPSQAALARIASDGFSDRFEVYWRGLELCNAFHELNDPLENRKRFDRDNSEKKLLGKSPVPVDDELLDALDQGMPPSGGIALGLERLYMAIHGVDAIQSVRPFTSKI